MGLLGDGALQCRLPGCGRAVEDQMSPLRQRGHDLFDIGTPPDDRRSEPVDESGVLHLKSAVSCLDDETLLVGPGTVPETMFDSDKIVNKVESELHLTSTLRIRNGRLLMTANAPETAERVAAAGFDIDLIDMSEFQAVDGGLTCLSILLSN